MECKKHHRDFKIFKFVDTVFTFIDKCKHCINKLKNFKVPMMFFAFHLFI